MINFNVSCKQIMETLRGEDARMHFLMFSKRTRIILGYHYVKGVSLAKIGRKLGMGRERVRQLEKRALWRLCINMAREELGLPLLHFIGKREK